MADFWIMRHGSTFLAPDAADSAAEIAKLPFGKRLRASVSQPRNAQRHRLYWALCHRIAAATGATPENISDVLKIAAGHCNIVRTKSLGDVKLPRSIAFHRMDESEFRTFFERCVAVIVSEWGIQRRDVLDAVADLLKLEEA